MKIKCNEKLSKYKSFQVMEGLLTTENDLVRMIDVYRPGYSKKARQTQGFFLEEFSDYLSGLSEKQGRPLIMGDFNFHMERPDDHYTKKFHSVLDEYGLVQCCPLIPTHDQGGTLDLIITTPEMAELMGPVSVLESTTGSDHYLVSVDFQAILDKQPESEGTFTYRDFQKIDIAAFRSDVRNSKLCSDGIVEMSLDEAVEAYNSVLTSLMDKHCPLITKKKSSKKKPWMDEELQSLLQKRRQSERLWRKRKDCQERRQKYRDLCKEFCKKDFLKRCAYTRKSFNASKGDTKMLYKKLNRLLGKAGINLPAHKDAKKLANDFGNFFSDKVVKIREGISTIDTDDTLWDSLENASNDNENGKGNLDRFEELSLDQVGELVLNMSDKFCDLDPIPTFLLKECLEELGPIIQFIINQSIRQARFPSQLKTALIKPNLKEESSDHDILANYRPVSNLPVMSKILEKAILSQLNRYLESESLHCPVQSGYRPNHSCETLMISLMDDVLKRMGNGDVVILLLLDLSAAFDTIDHNILVQRLMNDFGITDTALQWLESYLEGRSFSVNINQALSDAICLLFGVPQGSLLGPILFILYIKPLRDIALKYGLEIHLYADDAQLYISFIPTKISDWESLRENISLCLHEIREWMVSNCMKINESKTQLLVIAKKLVLRNLDVDINLDFGGATVLPTECKGDKWISLGVKLDECMAMDRQLNEVKQKCNWTLLNLRRVTCYLDESCRIMLVKQMVIMQLDYCNSIYMNLPQTRFKKLCSVLNSGIRFIYNIKDRNLELLPYYLKAHILPMKQRVHFKICMMTHKVVYGIAPPYMCNLLKREEHSVNTRLRPDLDNLRLKVPKLPISKLESRRFSIYAPELWNSLPFSMRATQNLDSFKTCLKTSYFRALESSVVIPITC